MLDGIISNPRMMVRVYVALIVLTVFSTLQNDVITWVVLCTAAPPTIFLAEVAKGDAVHRLILDKLHKILIIYFWDI